MTETTTARQNVTVGAGRAVHTATVYVTATGKVTGGYTDCGSEGRRPGSSRIRPTDSAVTCKRCASTDAIVSAPEVAEVEQPAEVVEAPVAACTCETCAIVPAPAMSARARAALLAVQARHAETPLVPAVEEPSATPIADALAVYEAAIAEHGATFGATPACECGQTFGTRNGAGLHVSAMRKRAERAYDAATAAARAADPRAAARETERLLAAAQRPAEVVEETGGEVRYDEHGARYWTAEEVAAEPEVVEASEPVEYATLGGHTLARLARRGDAAAIAEKRWRANRLLGMVEPRPATSTPEQPAEPVTAGDDGLAHLMGGPTELLDACETAGPGRLLVVPSTLLDEVTCPRCLLLGVDEEVRRLGYASAARYLEERPSLRIRVAIAADRPDSTEPVPVEVLGCACSALPAPHGLHCDDCSAPLDGCVCDAGVDDSPREEPAPLEWSEVAAPA